MPKKLSPYSRVIREPGFATLTYIVDLRVYPELAHTEVRTIEAWYDRLTKDWVIQRKDINGYQIGESYRGWGKDWADFNVGSLVREELTKARLQQAA